MLLSRIQTAPLGQDPDDSSLFIDTQAAAGNTNSCQSIGGDLSHTLPEYRVKVWMVSAAEPGELKCLQVI